MKELSVFCDESGDFGPVSPHSPYYFVGFVFHDQSFDITGELQKFKERVFAQGQNEYVPVHTAPLIRREEKYRNLDGAVRKKLFDTLFAFFRHCELQIKVIDIDKRWYGFDGDLEERIAKELGTFVRDSLKYFQSYDRVVVYYDRGQKEISRTLRIIFGSTLSNVEFRIVSPRDYLLFQVADLACTMFLTEKSVKNLA